MKTITTIMTLMLFIATAQSQNVYQQKMGEALGTFSQVESIEDFKSVAAKFELISNVETKEWLPIYYHAQSYILMSFSDKTADADAKDAYLKVAENDIEKMIEIAPKETEVYALQALYYTAKLVIDPMTRGQKYGALTQTAIKKSLGFDSQNPRARQLDLSNKVGTAKFFGSDISPYCSKAQELLNDWDNYEQKSPFHPTWGKDQVQGILTNCTPDEDQKKEITKQTSAIGNALTVQINKLKSNNGLVMLELLNENEETVTQTVGKIENNTCTIILDDIEEGTYSIRFFHDSNENKKMDSNERGVPTESYGFSNNAKGFMGAPKYKKTLFVVSENQTLQLKAR